MIYRELIFMTISTELESTILRYFYVEKWRIGTIGSHLKIHHDAVRRVLAKAGVPISSVRPKKSMIDPYLPFILGTLDKHPKLSAARLHGMVCERGYTGSQNHFRYLVSLHRPRRAAEAFLRLRTLPAEQAQVDWAHFGHVMVGKAKRPLMAFVMVLSFSRKIFLYFYLNCRMANFLRGHEAAFTHWGGVPRVLLYDNLKSAVLERQGDAIRFNPILLSFSAHYRFEPRPVAVCRGNEKGRVERAIRYVRDNFFAARVWKDIDDLNAQAGIWCDGVASDRICPEDNSSSVRMIFEQEKEKLYPLPDNPYLVDEREEVKVGKTPYVRFDQNDYSIPHTHVRRTLTVLATLNEVAILDGTTVLARHPRCYNGKQQIEQESHIKMLAQHKKASREHRGLDRLAQSAPSSLILLNQAAEQGYSLRTIKHSLIQLLDNYGAIELECAIVEALSRNSPHPNAVQITLEKRREEQQRPPPLSLILSADSRVRELVILPHNLKNYDQLSIEQENDDE